VSLAGQPGHVRLELRFWCGAPGRIRTRDPLLRRQLLCPAELRALEGNCVRRRSRDGHPKVAVCRLDAAPPRETLAASSPRTSNRRGYRKVPSTQSRSSPASCPTGSPGAPAGQLRVEARPAITSESRLLKHGLERLAPSGWRERSGGESSALEDQCSEQAQMAARAARHPRRRRPGGPHDRELFEPKWRAL
jgi:hypothetical protein